MTDTPDAVLLEQFARNHSEAAFAALVQRHIALVHSVALRHMASPQHAQDITQAVFIILARKAATLGGGTILPGWLYHTARLTAANFQRAEMRRICREQEAYMQSMPEETPTDVIWRELALQLDAAMAGLGTNERNALVLRYFQNKSIAEVGASLGLAENTAQKRVSRALEKLRKFFTRGGVSSTTAIIAAAISANSVQAAPAALARAVTTAAIAKEATVSTSTLTLIKGALKLMAWTKTKTAIVASIGLLLAVGTTTAIQKHISDRHYEDLFIHMDSAHLRTAPPALMLRQTRYPNRGNLSIGGAPEVPGKFIARNRPLEYLLLDAYGITPQRMVFAKGMPTGNFDFLATQPNDPKAGLRKLIEKQLGLTCHVETREEDVLVVKVAHPGTGGLKTTQGAETSVFSNPGKMTINNFNMSGMVECLGLLFSHPMVDETGFTNSYDLELHWDGWFDIPKSDDQKKLVERALLDQAGLELVPDRRPVEMLIIEKAG
jgi:uncharacterized protein (TIGR03435 family)